MEIVNLTRIGRRNGEKDRGKEMQGKRKEILTTFPFFLLSVLFFKG